MPILTILTAIGTALATVGGYVVDSITLVWDGVWKIISFFMDNAPRPLKIFVFLFLLVSVGNLFSNFFLGSGYACTSDAQLYQSNSLFEGIGNRIRMSFFGWTITETDNFIKDNYNRISQQEGMTSVRCEEGNPRLYFYSINIFSYNLWLLLLVLIYLTPMALKYYQRMGALH